MIGGRNRITYWNSDREYLIIASPWIDTFQEGDNHASRDVEPAMHDIFEAELQDVIPICHATIAGTRIVGRLTAGAKANHDIFSSCSPSETAKAFLFPRQPQIKNSNTCATRSQTPLRSSG
ncbi:hypothetical protein I7I51_06719 [Histoplasma capsulatum]|uniref:Uncharacterized protein n=1 Tax=Ajellomyces capsulatus TaxID=5037 RepID=A0A8A1MGX8_AJECA|nr:hypothetical protein I7I51_06719 [Histoplasma capsulatum]